jgi:16S rRNA (guanine527-N7)-methyltransferase
VELIKKYFPNLTAEQLSRFEALGGLYAEWNSKINVISRKDIDELYVRHVLHSLAIAKVINFKEGTQILDVGCGGGFPGIPLAIFFPEVQFTLVDSIGKKIMVVNEVASSLGLTNVVGVHERAEKMKDKYDFIVSRAVTAFPKFVVFTRKLIAKRQINAIPNGIIYLKGGDFMSEIEPFKKITEVFNIPDFFTESFFETKKVIYLPVV